MMVSQPPHERTPYIMLLADIATGKATKRSLAVIWALAVANASYWEQAERDGSIADGTSRSTEFWQIMNAATGRFLKPNGTPDEQTVSTDPVRRIAWEIHDQCCRISALAGTKMEDGK